MTAIDLCQLLLVAGVAAYLQTLTGFAFGLVMMGAIALLGLASLADAAIRVIRALKTVNTSRWQFRPQSVAGIKSDGLWDESRRRGVSE